MKPFPKYEFSPIFKIILQSKRNERSIRREFKKMVDFYKENPDAFYENLIATKENLENRESKGELSPGELNALKEIDNLLNSVLDPDAYFLFGEELLVNDFTKIYKQMKMKCTIDQIRENVPVEIHYYTINSEIPEDDMICKDSKISVEKLKVNTIDFLFQYQMLYN
jgi:hypothetical protein